MNNAIPQQTTKSQNVKRALHAEIRQSPVLASEASSVVLKNGEIVEVDASASCIAQQPDSDLYGHPEQTPPNLFPFPPGVAEATTLQ